MRRSEQREHIFKLLFMTQFNTENEMPEQLSIYFEGLGEVSEKDQEAIQQKYDHILEHLDEIDGILNDYSRGWKTTRMNRVDLTALRLAVYEMKMDEDVPVGVAINEAVELAKRNGTKLIVITSNRDTILKEYADACIFYETRESILETGSITTKLTQIFIIDLLYTQVVKDTMDLASAFKQRTTEAINILRLDNKK